jgi:hypothetical protein
MANMANPVDLVSADVTVTVGDASTPYQQPSSQSTMSSVAGGCCMGCIGTLGVLSFIALRVSCLCFFVSGAVFLAEEYNHIPDCASAYRGWGIAMTVLCGLAAFKADSKNETSSSGFGTASSRTLGIGTGISLWIVSIFSFLIAFLGHRDVLQMHDATCDVSDISQLETWTWWIYGFYGILTILLWAGGLFLIVAGACSR